MIGDFPNLAPYGEPCEYHDMTITKKIIFDDLGEPSEVVIPYDEFVELSEAYGWDMDETERTELKEAIADSRAGNHEAFVNAADV